MAEKFLACFPQLALPQFPAFLRVQAQRGDGAGLQSFYADLLTGLLAVTVFAFLDAVERLVDLADELAVTVARPQFQAVLRFPGRPLRFVTDELASRGLISSVDFAFTRICTTVEAGVEEICRFYSTFHSYRFVGRRTVLRLNREIGDELYVSLNTVKSHLKTIYRKLDVERRDDAVRRARQMGIL